MGKRRRELDSDVTAAETAEFNTVFVDTSLGTHLAMLVRSSDTVSDFKKKMALEHKQCFPTTGEILINSVKVKRSSNFYHLPDIMLVWSAFHGVKRNWFLSADVSETRSILSIKSSCEFDTNNGVKMGVTNLDDDSRGISSDVNRTQTLPIPFPDGAAEKNVVSETMAGFKLDKSVEKTTGFQSNICSEENSMGTDSRPKKKSKVNTRKVNTVDVCHNPRYEDDDNLFQASYKDTSIPKVVGSANVMVDAVRESPRGGILLEKNGEVNDHFDAEDRACPPTTTEKSNLRRIMTSQNLLASDERNEENLLEGKMDHELAQDAPTNHFDGVSDKVPDHSAKLMDAGCGVGEVNTNGSKRKKRKERKTARNVQEQSGKGESSEPYSETHESDKKEKDGILLEQNGEVNDYFDAEDKVVFKGTSAPTTTQKSNLGSIMTSQNLLASDERKEENWLESKMDHELAQDVPTNHLEDVSGKVLDRSARLMDADCGVGEVDTDGSKRRKRKAQKTARNVQDTTEKDQSGKGESIKPCSETRESDKKEKEKGLSLEHGHEVIMPSNSKISNHVDPESVLKKESFLQDAEPEISSGIKKKRKKKKFKEGENPPVNTNPEQSGVQQTDDNGTSGSLPPSTDHIPQENGNEEGMTNHGKEEGIANPEGKDVQVLLSAGDATEEVQGVIRNMGDSVILTQTEQILEDVGSGKKIIIDKKTQRSDGNYHAGFSAVEIENPVTEFNQVENSNENTKNKDRKTSKKRKKRTLTASQAHEDFPVENQQVGNEALVTKETSINFVNSEQEGRIGDSSQVLSRKTEEKLKVTRDITEETSEKEGEGIDFKQYFVPGQSQDKLDSGDEVKKGTKLIQEMETSKTVKDNVIPSVSNSTELQSSVKSFENKSGENRSRKGGSRSIGELTLNSDHNEMIPKSFRRSSGASGNGAKCSKPSGMCETTPKKPNENLAASSRVNKKNRTYLEKPSSQRSEIFPGMQGNKWLQSGMSITKMMPFKTPQKKSLFTKPGAIFQDNSDESSGDENGTMHSDGNTLSPSDSSSMSGHSVEQSDLSQESTRNRSSDAEGRSTGRRNMSKLDFSASQDDITMDMNMILRSSKRFKKAKLLASQNEDEQNESHPVEFVPDSQPI